MYLRERCGQREAQRAREREKIWKTVQNTRNIQSLILLIYLTLIYLSEANITYWNLDEKKEN